MKNSKGQGLVEFALVLPIFIAVMAGLLDGTRLLFTYNELQEAARVGARWGAVEVDRDSWGTFAQCGNYPGTYTAASTPVGCTAAPSSTIVSEAFSKLVAVDRSQVTVVIGQNSLPSLCTNKTGTNTSDCMGTPVTVNVCYQFRPVLGFGHFDIPLAGKAVAYHE
jgi:Flp pilus assembly protein TadG